MKRHRKRQEGIALLMVLSTIALLTTLVVDFGYNSHIAYTMASNNRDRLQAYYLTRSALGFARLQVKIEKDIRSQLAKYAKYLEGVVGSEPICTLMPFSTGLLRGFTDGAAEGGLEGGAEDSGETVPTEGVEEGAGGGLQFEGIMAAAAASDFLSFEGDFSVSCYVEDSKMNLNYFRQLNPEEPIPEEEEVNDYERHKRLLESLLAGSAYNEFFEDTPEKRRELVNNIADWVDTNNLVDEQPGFQGGYEDQYYQDRSYTVKNGKMSTPGELLLIEGMSDDIYNKLYSNVTIYGDDKINVCLADDEMVKAFVVRYSNTTAEIDPILPDNDELLAEILDAVRQACLTPLPKANEVANAIRGILGLEPEAAVKETKSKSKTKTAKKDEDKEGDEEKKPVAKTLTEQIVTENRYYSFDLTGSAGDIILRVRAVLHVEDKDPEKWPLLFYKVQ